MYEPSPQIESLITAVAVRPTAAEGMTAMKQRECEFASPLAAKLTGIALDPNGRSYADQFLDTYWADERQQADTLNSAGDDREVIIGSGFHAAVYAATRVLSGFPRPLVLERSTRVGGTFAMTARPTFYLNSRNRPGNAGLAGDQGTSLNYLPGASIQAAAVSMVEYQPNTDMAFVIRLALAQFADVVPDANVLSVTPDGAGVRIVTVERGPLLAGRIVDARGLGDPIEREVANRNTILRAPRYGPGRGPPLPGPRLVGPVGADLWQARDGVRAATGVQDGEPLILAAYGYGDYGRHAQRVHLDVLCAINAAAQAHQLSGIVGDWLASEGAPNAEPMLADEVAAGFAAAFVGVFSNELAYTALRLEQIGWDGALRQLGAIGFFDTAAYKRHVFDHEVRAISISSTAGGGVAVYRRRPS